MQKFLNLQQASSTTPHSHSHHSVFPDKQANVPNSNIIWRTSKLAIKSNKSLLLVKWVSTRRSTRVLDGGRGARSGNTDPGDQRADCCFKRAGSRDSGAVRWHAWVRVLRQSDTDFPSANNHQTACLLNQRNTGVLIANVFETDEQMQSRYGIPFIFS